MQVLLATAILFFCCCRVAAFGSQDLDIWLLGPGFQDLDNFALRTWVSGPRQMHSYRTPKALHPTVVLSFSRHFSLRPVVTDRLRPLVTNGQTCACTQQLTLYIR
jgi:hypothetical protein